MSGSRLTLVIAIVSPTRPTPRAAMGKHLTATELDPMQAWKAQGLRTMEIFRRLQHARASAGEGGPHLATVRRAMRGLTHKRGRVEAWGRKRALSPANVQTVNSARKRLIQKADGQNEVHWDDVIRAARVPRVDRSTAAKSMKAAGYDIQRRAPRQKIVAYTDTPAGRQVGV